MSLPPLAGVAATCLWTLHCRARSAARGVLDDPEALRIEAAYGGALAARFGRPDPCFGERARIYDAIAQASLDAHPQSAVVSLGEGLETQRFRLRGYRRWTSVDLPEVIAVREALLPATPPGKHRACSVTAPDWHEDLGEGPALVIAQGLVMYLAEADVRALVERLSTRPRTTLLFDVVPPWTSRLSRLRPPMAGSLRMPPMPWGATAEGLRHRLRRWAPGASVELVDVPMPSGPTPFRFGSVAALVETPGAAG